MSTPAGAGRGAPPGPDAGALEELATLVRRESGIDIQGARFGSLAAAIGRAAPGLGPREVLRAVRMAADGRSLLMRLIEAVTVQETYFFRQRGDLDALDWHELLAGARADGAPGVRVWIAACATGEEAYTLAIMACEAFGTRTPPVTIIATDISPAALLRAELGRYGRRSVRGIAPDLCTRYLAEAADRLEVQPALRDLVRFHRHNLVQAKPPVPVGGRFDLIVCRNVLIYFRPETVERVLALLEASLAPGGSLVLGAADRLSGPALRSEPRERRDPRPRKDEARPAAPATVTLAQAMRAADAGELETAIAISEAVLELEPLNADAHFVRGLAALGSGEGEHAVASLRRALYIDPSFALAAFQLARAHDALGNPEAARRAYRQALRTLDPGDARHRDILKQVDLADIAAACRARLGVLEE